MEIKIVSQKYGEFLILIDDEDYERYKMHTWRVTRDVNSNYFYVRTSFYNNEKKRTTISLQRFIMNTPKGMFTDHINHYTLDNRKSNLRICTIAENSRNAKKQKNGISSKYKGVTLKKGRCHYRAQIRVDNKLVQIGNYETEVEAALAYNLSAIKHYKEFAFLNEIDEETKCAILEKWRLQSLLPTLTPKEKKIKYYQENKERLIKRISERRRERKLEQKCN